ncbi:VWA domain-containing protein [Myxococcota bacterium]|nr:VWA domain-containing protein [Myxococcota bacterium]
MQKKILEFADILRKSGIRVSTAETIDAFEALDLLSLDEREQFRDTLRATMVKRGEDVPTFDELFDLFWSGFYDSLRDSFGDAANRLGDFGVDLDELLKQISQMLEGMDGDMGDLSELAQAMLTADLNQIEQLIMAAANAAEINIENFLQIGFFSRRTLEQMGLDDAGGELRDLAAALEAAGMDPQQLAALREFIDGLMDAARKSVRNFTERELQKQNHDYMEKFRRETLLEKSFYHLSEEEVRKMREVVERLAQKIKNILSIRRRRLNKGKLDLHQTLRKNMALGGVPFNLIFKQRKKDRPKLVILCDVSSSVANVSRFMLQFCYSLQEAFSKIRSYVFVAELGEVTHTMEEGDINEAIEEALEGGGVINVYTRSNFGHAFHHFWQNYLSAIDNKTTVLILGDARNNYNDARAWCLRDIHNKAKNVVWLNPESPSAWGFGDSVMDRYRPYIDVAEECRNLRQLNAVIDRLIL